MSRTEVTAHYAHDEPTIMLVYGGHQLAIEVQDADNKTVIVLHPNTALHLMMELREALRDLHHEPTDD